MRTLGVLLWKQCLVRKRRILGSLLELASTLTFFIILFAVRKKFTFDDIEYDRKSVQENMPYLLNTAVLPTLIYYYPETNYTKYIMDQAGPKLKLYRSPTFNDTRNRMYYGIPLEEKNLHKYIDNLKFEQAVVIFENVDNYPLQYTIRMRENFVTNTIKPLTQMDTPHENFATIYDPFMRIQWAIDSSFIELRSHDKIRQKVFLQEFPAPRIKIDTNAAVKCVFIKICCIGSLFVTFVYGISRLLEERCTGIQELVKMVGVNSLKLGAGHIIDSIPVGIMYSVMATLVLTVTSSPLVHIPAINVFLFFILQYFSIVAQAFASSYLIKTSNHAVSFAFLMYILLMMPALYVNHKYSDLSTSTEWMKKTGHVMSGILPQMPVLWFWQVALVNEAFHYPTTFKDTKATYIAFLIQIVFYLLLTWYLEKVRPGLWGVALPWNFMFKKQYWFPDKVSPQQYPVDDEFITEAQERDPVYFEEEPKNLEIGIKIANVYKEYGDMFSRKTHKVLSNVNFNIFKGEITVLLGHNGAGKTTLMSIITGMIKATAGDVYVNNLHTIRDKAKIHKILGLCPQVNLFFPDLTVLEHVMFFALLKGGSLSQARSSSMELLNKLKLTERANHSCSQLSGGMQRRVQLTCALAGGAEVLVLDEPTSGLDVATRRELWNLLLALRGDRTVLLTTHFMEEADALGDRIAVLHGGVVKCHATPMYLKKSIGSGYRLTLNTLGAPLETKITSLVRGVIRDAQVKEKAIHSISYSLPARDTNHFPELFNKLEHDKAKLEIAAIGVGVTTLEEVFLSLCKDVADKKEDSRRASIIPHFEKVTGRALTMNRFMALFRRQYLYTLSKIIKFVLCEVMIPLGAIILVAYYTNNEQPLPENSSRMLLDPIIYGEIPAHAYYHVNTSLRTSLTEPINIYPTLKFRRSNNISKDAFNLALSDQTELNKYVVGIEVNDSVATVLYTTKYRHAAPVGLNMLSNMLASAYLPETELPAIYTYNQPVKRTHTDNPKNQKPPKSESDILIWGFMVTVVILMTFVNYVALPCIERTKGSRSALLMCGPSHLLYWSVTLLYNMLVYMLVLVVPTILIARFLDFEDTFCGLQFYVAMFVVMFLGGLASNAIVIFISTLLQQRMAELFLVIVMYVFAMITLELESEFLLDPRYKQGLFEKLLACFGTLLPSHNFLKAVLRIVFISRFNAMCEMLKPSCPNTNINFKNFDTTVCCESGDSAMYSMFGFSMFTPMYSMMFLVLNFFLYMIFVIQIEKGHCSLLWEKLFKKVQPLIANPFRDPHVREERDYVEKMINKPNSAIHDAVLVKNLKKEYISLCKKNNFAVKGIDFSVKRGECFGLLGVNGAGKSTTFKMLTAEVNRTEGQIFAYNTFLTTATRSQYIENLAYCPQFFGLDEFLTSRDTLTLLMLLRGYNRDDVTRECESWIKNVGLEKYADRRISTYSGGCMRRIGTAAALCQRAGVAMLDEPTSGVDPTSRRRVWTALQKGLSPETSVIITSHSMDEMEVLCDRIAIMNAGWLCAVGPISHLRAQHAQGQSIQIKLRNDYDSEAKMQQLQEAMSDVFDLVLKDSHRTMLHYHLNKPLPYSELFTKMQKIVSQHPVIEDYSVSETTLEEVFLSLAAKGKGPETA